MNGNNMLDAMEFIDDELIMAAEPVPNKTAKIIRLRLVAAAVCVIIACMLLVAVPFLSAPPSPPPIITPPTESTTEASPTTDPKQTTNPGITPTSTINFITIDVNPSLKIAVDKGLVLSCEALNDDGQQILKDIDVHGTQLEIALPIVIEALINNGYIKTDLTNPVILLSAHGGEDAHELLEQAAKISADVTALHNLSAFIITQKVEYAIDTAELAEVYGISTGKMQYILNLIERKKDLSISELAKAPIKELFGIDISNQPDSIISGYDRYGEKILLVKTEDGDATLIHWDKLSQSEKQEILNIYTSLFPDETILPFESDFETEVDN